MAGIDKTYVKNWKDYKEVRDWAKKHRMVYPNGKKGELMINWFYEPNLTKKNFNGQIEHVIWNTSTAVDRFLAKNCDIKLIQDRLHEQYGDDGYQEELINFVPSKIERLGKNIKFAVIKKPHFKVNNNCYSIYVGNELRNSYPYVFDKDIEKSWGIDNSIDEWIRWDEGMELNCDCEFYRKPINSEKAILRKLQKMNLPKNVYVAFIGDFGKNDVWIIKTK